MPTLEPRWYQRAAIDKTNEWLAERDDNPCIVLPTGCHAKGTLILMADGSTKAVDCIRVGDLVMGPDSLPRVVLSLARGVEDMYQIAPKKGAPFIVNASHMLALRTTNEGKNYPSKTTGHETESISVKEYLGKSKYWKHLRKLYRVAVDFPPIARPDLDPWVLGALLGDGYIKTGVRLSNPDEEILDALWAEMQRHGLEYTAKYRQGAWHISFPDYEATRCNPNRVSKILRDLGVFGLGADNKFIPVAYKLGSANDRLNVLAGLLDTDGHLTKNSYDFISKSKRLSEDVVFIARSLGLAAYCRPATKRCQTGYCGVYWRVSISGDTDRIPVRCSRKKALARTQKKDPLVTGFTVTPAGIGEYFGFHLSGDHLYLTADFTVHHNSGKSPTMALMIREYLTAWPETRICVLAHVKELVQQNAEKAISWWPDAPMGTWGIYSASLGQRDTDSRVIFASIQSVHRKAFQLGRFDLIFVDEAHRIPARGEGMYRNFLQDCYRANPHLRVIGFTATPYRLDVGEVCGDENILNGISFEISVKSLIEQGYLCQLITRSSQHALPDVSGVHKRGGEYIASELESAVNQEDLVVAACREMLRLAQDRNHWIVFAAGIEHANNVADHLRDLGVAVAVVTGDTPQAERDQITRDYQHGRYRALVNVNVLSEGFDATHIDCVVLLRPTLSPGLYYQQVGRGLRLDPSKESCLVLDFAGNTMTHGPIDALTVHRKKSSKNDDEPREAPAKTCPQCESIVAAGVHFCPQCNHEFEFDSKKHEAQAQGGSVLSGESTRYEINHILYDRHTPRREGAIPSMRVDYHEGYRRVASEWVCFEHEGFARAKAERWWALRTGWDPDDTPLTIDAALTLAESGALREPVAIHTKPDGKFTRIVDYEWPERPAAQPPAPLELDGMKTVEITDDEFIDDVPF